MEEYGYPPKFPEKAEQEQDSATFDTAAAKKVHISSDLI